MDTALVGAVLCVLLLILWMGIRIEDTRTRRRNCVHEWKPPICFAGYWTKHCALCGAQEACPPPSGWHDDDGTPRA